MKKQRHLSRRRAGTSADKRSLRPRPADAGVTLVHANSPPSIAEAYDEGLVDRLRQQWRQGDWDAMVEVPMEQLENHPLRAKLAVLVASAWQAQGKFGQTRQLIQLARQWGADEDLLARVLLAGVHNTLGRAAAAGGRMRDQALFHFRAALQPAGAVAAGRMGLQMRVRQELASMGLPAHAGAWLSGSEPLGLPPMPSTSTAVAVNAPDVVSRLDELGKTVESTLQRELSNAVKQLEAYNNLQGYLQSGELMPALHGWPVSPDFALLLVQILEQHEFDAIVEFGSGSSTLLVAKTLANIAQRRPRQRKPAQVAFEHLEKYHAGTRDLLEGGGLLDRVDLRLAPLQPTTMANGDTFRYYDVSPGLEALVQRLADVPAPRVLVIVDGPPEATGPFARYPALELLLQALPRQRGAYLMDDYRRPGEQEIARRWRAYLAARGIESQLAQYPLEKMACMIRFDASSALPGDTVPRLN